MVSGAADTDTDGRQRRTRGEQLRRILQRLYISLEDTSERSGLFGVVEGVKRYWGNFRFMSGRKWLTRHGFCDSFGTACRR